MRRTYYKYTCRILAMVLAIMTVSLFAVSFKLLNQQNAAMAAQMEYEDYKAEADKTKAELLKQLDAATAPTEPAPTEPEPPTEPETTYREHLGEFTITYYCACEKCCGKTDGITASGAVVREGVTVAVDRSVIPLGTYLYIEGIGYRVAQDVGGAIKGNKIDVYMKNHNDALKCGVEYNVNVWRMIEHD